MRAEVKVGLIVGLVILCGAGIWWVNRSENEVGDLPFNRAAMDKTGGDVSLTGDSKPAATAQKKESRTPRGAPGMYHPTPPPERRTTTLIKPPGSGASPVAPPLAAESKTERETTLVEHPKEGEGERPHSPTDSASRLDDAKGPPPEPVKSVGEPEKPNVATAVEQDTPAPRIIPPPRREPEPASPVNTSTSAAPTTPRKKYVIKPGDRLIDIAEYEYDNGDLWKAIKAANPGLDENRLLVGKTIELPSRAEAEKLVQAPPAPTAPTSKKTSGPAVSQATYVVGPGDTLIKIARNVLGDEERWREIYELNRSKLDSPDVIQLGMELKLPPKSKPKPSEDRG